MTEDEIKNRLREQGYEFDRDFALSDVIAIVQDFVITDRQATRQVLMDMSHPSSTGFWDKFETFLEDYE